MPSVQHAIWYIETHSTEQLSLGDVVAAGAPDILPLAVASGYGSHEAFTRAFRDTFGLPPEDVRKRGNLEGFPILAPIRVIEEPVCQAPEVRAELIGPLLLIGIEASYLASDTAGIPSQWQRLHSEQSLPRNRYTY